MLFHLFQHSIRFSNSFSQISMIPLEFTIVFEGFLQCLKNSSYLGILDFGIMRIILKQISFDVRISLMMMAFFPFLSPFLYPFLWIYLWILILSWILS